MSFDGRRTHRGIPKYGSSSQADNFRLLHDDFLRQAALINVVFGREQMLFNIWNFGLTFGTSMVPVRNTQGYGTLGTSSNFLISPQKVQRDNYPWSLSCPGNEDVPVFDGRQGVDWTNLWQTPLCTEDIPATSFAMIGLTINSYPNQEKNLLSDLTAGFNIQFAVWLN
ncbi:hypothetical protein K439DRAFT_1621238 [Ramaria rubella]|nr:hypothetical protein K439DRAFT_1621238 [Ramaria rubella]